MPIGTQYGIADFYCSVQGRFISLLCLSGLCICLVLSSLKAERELSEVVSNETLNSEVYNDPCVKRSTN